MKNWITAFALFALIGCNSNNTTQSSLDAGREFIRASLNGEFDKAEQLLLPTKENTDLFESYKRYYRKMPEEQKRNYKNSSYDIHKYLELDDSTTIINYSNSYMNKPMEIKVVMDKDEWKVDFTYTYSGNLPID